MQVAYPKSTVPTMVGSGFASSEIITDKEPTLRAEPH